MRRPVSLEEFAKLVDLDAGEIESYRDKGLLDPDGDRLFDEYDALRLRVLQIAIDRGETLDSFARTAREPRSTDTWGFFEQLWPAGKSITPEDAADQLGVSVEDLQALRVAAGLPGTLMTEDDFEMFRGIKQIVDAGFPFDSILEAARVLGDSMRRFAQTEIRLSHIYLHEPLLESGVPERDVARQAQDVIDNAIRPVIEPIILEIHKQHMLRAVLEDVVEHIESAERAGKPGTVEAAILFVDLSSFTSLTYQHGDEAAARVIDRFEGLVRSLVLDHRGSLVKQIGDEFMLAFKDTADALSFSLGLDQRITREEEFPTTRIGIDAGPVIFRAGDYVGHTVNTASRITSAAAPGEIVFTEPVARVAEKAEIPVEEVGMRLLRGVSEPLKLFRVIRTRVMQRKLDPVCGMAVADNTFCRLEWDGREYAFCSKECLDKFLQNPEQYTLEGRTPDTPKGFGGFEPR